MYYHFHRKECLKNDSNMADLKMHKTNEAIINPCRRFVFFALSHRISVYTTNKANLRDLIAATGQVVSNWIQIVNFSARVTVKFDGWPRKTIGHFFYTTSSFVHHFKSIGEFKLDLQSRNAPFGSKLVICYPVWPWNSMDDLWKTIGHFFYATSSFAAFRSHWWIQTGVTVRKRPIWVKFDDF